MKVGILTGGGDVPGLNACIKAATLRAIEEGHEVVGIRRGWGGLLESDPDDVESIAANVIKLDPAAVRTIDRTGGTVLHTSRTNPAKVRPSEEPSFLAAGREDDERRDHTDHVLKVMGALGIDAMIPIGGDDTLSFALRLHDEGVPVVAIPKTMDNDVHGTDYCIGFSTAVTRTVNFIHQLRTSAGSHERLAVVEVFGRYSGETSLVSAYLSGVERAIISEVPFEIERLANYLVDDKRRNPSGYAMMTISEGASLVGGDMIMGGKEDAPDSLDLMVAINYAVMAADLLVQGQTGRLVALRNGNYVNVPIDVTRQGVKRVDVGALYDAEAYRPKIRHVDGKPMFLY
jgi:6-phosphofructokinase 1